MPQIGRIYVNGKNTRPQARCIFFIFLIKVKMRDQKVAMVTHINGRDLMAYFFLYKNERNLIIFFFD